MAKKAKKAKRPKTDVPFIGATTRINPSSGKKVYTTSSRITKTVRQSPPKRKRKSSTPVGLRK